MSKGLTRYVEVLTNLKEKIRLARQKSMLAVNAHLIIVYYEIGAAILEQQTTEGWGAKVIDRLSIDLRLAFPDMKGFSVRNIKYMRAFAEAWPEGFQENNGRMQNVENQ